MSDLIRQLESKENLVVIIDLIRINNNIPEVSPSDIRNIIRFLRGIDGEKILRQTGSIDAANQALVDTYTTHLNTTRSLADEYNMIDKYTIQILNTAGDDGSDTQTLTDTQAFRNRDAFKKSNKKETFADINNFKSLSDQDKIDIVKFINYKSLWRESYIIIDSRYQNMVNTDPTQIAFSLQTLSKKRTDNGGVIVGESIRNIIELQVYPFTIPYNPVFDNFYKKITMTINEWTGSSFEAYEQGAFHFIFDITKIDKNLIYLTPSNNTYSFSKPVNYIDNFTISFGAMLPKISFDIDRMYPSHIDYSSTEGIITFSSDHNLVTGDLVYITGFSSFDVATDVDIINEVNRISGHIIVKKNNYSIIINVDISSMYREYPINSGVYPITTFDQSTVLVYFASKRIQIPMCFRYIVSPDLVK